MTKFEAFATKVEALCAVHGEKRLDQWLDNQQVCQLLRISKRTLHTYRSNGLLGYSQINHKMFYRPQDIERLLARLNQGEL